MRDVTLAELFSLYYFVYVAYYDEGFIVAFDKSEQKLMLFVKFDHSKDNWAFKSSMGYQDTFHSLNYHSMRDAASDLVHRWKKPW